MKSTGSAFFAAMMILAGLVSTTQATTHHYAEDFTSAAYKGPATTSVWDTAVGEIRLAPWSPSLVGYTGPDTFKDVSVVGDRLYAATTTGLSIMDVTTTSPSLLGKLPLTDGRSVTAEGDNVYLTTAPVFYLISALDPAVPFIQGWVSLTGDGVDHAVAGRYAFVVTSTALLVVDMIDPSNPNLASAVPLPSAANAVAVRNNYLYVAEVAATEIFYIALPYAPYKVDSIGPANDIALSGSRMILTTDTALETYDVSSAGHPVFQGTFPLAAPGKAIRMVGNFAYVAMGNMGMQVVDVTDPATPLDGGFVGLLGVSQGVDVSGNLAYVASGTKGVSTVSVAYPLDNPVHTSTIPAANPWSVVRDGDRMFMDYSITGSRMVNFSDPLHPVSGPFLSSHAQGAVLEGNTLYSCRGFVKIEDVSNPMAPVPIGSYSPPTAPIGIALSGDYLFVGGGSRLYSLDITDPTNPALLDSVGVDVDFVQRCGRILYTMGYQGSNIRFSSFKISNPANMLLLDTIIIPVGSFTSDDFRVVGDTAYLGNGLWIIDVSDPGAMVLKGSLAGYNSAYDVAASGNRAYIGFGNGFTCKILDTTTPLTPIEVGSIPLNSGYVSSIFQDGNYLMLGNYNMEIYQVWERNFLINGNFSESKEIDASSDEILFARLSSVQNDSIAWELSASGGVNWDPIPSDASWVPFTAPGNNLQWRATHIPARPALNPSASQLNIDWLYHYPQIEAIADIGNDQGRQVRLSWLRSGHEFSTDADPVLEYTIYRAIDPAAPVALSNAASPMTDAGDSAPTSSPDKVAGWDYLVTVPADFVDDYAVVVPTLADSSITAGQYFSKFMVRARTGTPGVFYDSYPDSGYSVDNLAPNVPVGFMVAYVAGSAGNTLDWAPPVDSDFRYFKIYRGTTPGFTPDASTHVADVTNPSWTDLEPVGTGVYYLVSAVDFAGNESRPASPQTVSGVGDHGIPVPFALRQNTPNPFNPITQISYTVPDGGNSVQLSIFDVQGKHVATLVDQRVSGGRHTVSWNGRDDTGKSLPSGTYFYRLAGPHFTSTRKMTLIN